jgi:hypothetical protein
LRHYSLDAPAWAVRTADRPETGADLARSVAKVLPVPWALSHVTAARLLALPLPVAWSVGEPLHVIRPTDRTRVRRAQVAGHLGLESRTVCRVHGRLAVTGPLSTWLDLASLLDLDDLVVAGDAVAARRPHAVTELTGMLADRPSAGACSGSPRRTSPPTASGRRLALSPWPSLAERPRSHPSSQLWSI